ncbi:MAG: SDR family oxidoreductase [Bryobacterales bacterium]|nr:SDR family oxidoreductase [Bryobacterales bacterium]
MESERLLLVTGGSRGIGAATALRAAAHGYFVCVNSRRSFEAAASVVDGIRDRGGDGIPVQADVGREKDVTRLFNAIDALPGNLVGVVNNAGTLAPAARLENMNSDRWNSILTTNLIGTMYCTREGIRRMSRRFGGIGGAIVNVSSAASRTGSPNEYVDYAASKGAIDSLTIGVAREVAQDGIRVNAVRPGFIRTAIHAEGGDPLRVERLEGALPMGRGGEPDEVAAAILWLLSDDASYVTGSFIDMAGGL